MPAKATLWNKLVKAVRNDPQRAGMLTVLVAILVVLQVRLQMNGKDGTARAVAGVTPRTDNSGAPGGSSSQPGKSPDGQVAVREWMNAPTAPLGRNLFAIELDRFPHDGSKVSIAASNPGFWDDLAKSMTFRADVRKERQILVENLQRQASQLRLQSTMMGAKPKAVIDGEMVEVGEVVASFRVLKIEARRIIVEREGIKLEILMK
ncbi:MAG: hypothetical protein ABIP55_03285 [Tepidisphaeraceae bacterium]